MAHFCWLHVTDLVDFGGDTFHCLLVDDERVFSIVGVVNCCGWVLISVQLCCQQLEAVVMMVGKAVNRMKCVMWDDVYQWYIYNLVGWSNKPLWCNG